MAFNKKEYIKKLTEATAKLDAQIESNNTKINAIKERTKDIAPKDKEQYHEHIQFAKRLCEFENQNNLLMAKSFVNKLNIKKAEISTSDNIDLLTSKQLSQFVDYFEQMSKGELFPFEQITLDKLTRATRRQYKTMIAYLHVMNKKGYDTKNKSAPKLDLQVKFLKKRYEYYVDYIKDLKLSFANKYLAKLVAKLEKIAIASRDQHQNDKKYVVDFYDVKKYYNNGILATKVLSNVNIKIKYGEFVVILGPSGSGKTTLLNIISGMDTATYGDTFVAQHNLIKYNVTKLTQFRRDNVGYVFQQYGLLPNLTVKENVEIGANLQKDKSRRIDIDELLKTINMYEFRNKFPRELSGGQQQRVSIARSVAKNPSIIFGDEPTGAVDEEMSKQIMQLFVDVNKKYNTTIIIVTHNPILAELATKVIHVANGTIKDVKENAHPKKVSQLPWGGVIKTPQSTI